MNAVALLSAPAELREHRAEQGPRFAAEEFTVTRMAIIRPQ
jgi:hypothetical protein